jgi:hypothetical protein
MDELILGHVENLCKELLHESEGKFFSWVENLEWSVVRVMRCSWGIRSIPVAWSQEL